MGINWFIKIKAYFQFTLTNIYLTYEIFVFNKSCSFLSLVFKNGTECEHMFKGMEVMVIFVTTKIS